jgi:hypothetical protein
MKTTTITNVFLLVLAGAGVAQADDPPAAPPAPHPAASPQPARLPG